jgi:hypothetical protein
MSQDSFTFLTYLNIKNDNIFTFIQLFLVKHFSNITI